MPCTIIYGCSSSKASPAIALFKNDPYMINRKKNYEYSHS